MMGFGEMLNDIELAAVLTYVRQSFGNDGELVTAEQVREVREATRDRVNFFTTEEILREHPLKYRQLKKRQPWKRGGSRPQRKFQRAEGPRSQVRIPHTGCPIFHPGCGFPLPAHGIRCTPLFSFRCDWP